MATSRKSEMPIPPWTLGLAVVLAAVLVYGLVPAEWDLAQRNAREGKPEIALRILRDMPEAQRNRDPLGFTLLRIQLERQLGKAGDLSSGRGVLDEACRAYRQFGYPRELLSEILLLTDGVPAARLARNWLSPHLLSMPLTAQHALGSRLTKRALAEADPRLAAEIHASFWRRSPLSEAGTLDMARLWRLAGQATAAREALGEHARRAGRPLERDSRALAWLAIALARENNLSVEAFEFTLALAGSVDLGSDAPVLELLIQTARESQRGLEALPLLENAANAKGGDTLLLERVADLAVETGALEVAVRSVERLTRKSPENARYWIWLGRLYEWRQEPSWAFDAYLKAMALRSYEGLPRLLALSGGLSRDAELAEALAAGGEPGGWPAPLRLELARLRVRVNDLDQARADYARVLAHDTGDPRAYREYGQVLTSLAAYDPAREAFARALTLSPEDRDARAGLAEALMRLGRHAEAYRWYELLAADTDRGDILDNYLSLAEHRGDLDDAAALLKCQLERADAPGPRDFLRLAHAQDLAGQDRPALATLDRGLARFPEDAALLRRAGYYAAKVKDNARSLRFLGAHPGLRTDVELARLYLEVLLEVENYAEAERFLGSGLPESVREHIAVLALEARLRDSLCQYDQAAALYARLCRLEPGRGEYDLRRARALALTGQREEARRILRAHAGARDPETLAWTVQVAVALRDFQLAATCQRRYVAGHPREMGKAEGCLGDILTSLGEGKAAREQYRRALDDYLAEIRCRNEL